MILVYTVGEISGGKSRFDYIFYYETLWISKNVKLFIRSNNKIIQFLFDKGHINPAVTWACLITNKISVLRALSYMVSQLIGGILGSALLKSILPKNIQYSMGCHGLNPLLTPGQGFGAEVIFTAIFIFVVFATGN